MSGRSHGRRSSAITGAIYARYSSRFQHSIEDQVRSCRDWAAANGILVPEEFVFADRAVSGRSTRRSGLQALRQTLEEDQVDVVIVFTTNRLARKLYQSLAFVEEEIVDRGKRCVFVRSGVDTDDTDRWRQLLQMHAMIDEFVVQMTAEHVRAAQEGLLLQTRVFGTVTFGYTGEPIPGQTTRLGKPARRLVVDPVAAEWVGKVFDWFVTEHLSIREIVRRLNAEQAPWPPRSCGRRWTRLAVRRMLSNSRYRGWWEYGRTKAVWVNKQSYVRQVEREKPLAGLQIESLRIIDDVTWHAAQELLSKTARNAGRKPNDTDHHSRPRVLNGLLLCGAHDRPLHVCGAYGKHMYCPSCAETAEPFLFSLLPRRLALECICGSLAELIQADASLCQQVIEASQWHVQATAAPDAGKMEKLRQMVTRLTSQIEFILDAPGETDQDRSENRQRLAKLRGERATTQRQLAELEAASLQPVTAPTAEEIRAQISELTGILQEATNSDDPAALAALREIIDWITGGRIVITQCGERRPQRGWLKATFQVHLLDLVARRAGWSGCSEDAVPTIEVEIKQPSAKDTLAEHVKVFYDEGLMNKEIAECLQCRPGRVSQLLKHWSALHGQPLPDGRQRRHSLGCKQMKIPAYQMLADRAKGLWDQGLAVLEISRQLGCSPPTVDHALASWHQSRGLPVPNGTERRAALFQRAKELLATGMAIQQIAALLGYTPRGMSDLLRRGFAAEGQTMPDGRSRRRQLMLAS